MTKRILFVTCNGIKNRAYGGAKGSIRNYNALKKYAEIDIYTIVRKSGIQSLLSLIQGFFPPINNEDMDAVKLLISKKKYDGIFFDGSYFGKMVEYCRIKKIKTFVYYHNCELDYIEVRFGKSNLLKKFIYKKSIQLNEKTCSLKSDYRIALSKRDAERIETLYDTKINKIIPLSIEDILEKGPMEDMQPYCLLLGPAGMANVEGFEWFVNKVSPSLECKTIIVGKGFEKYKKWETEKVKVIGYVENVNQVYKSALCVAIPLFSGAGMKIKTAEAMMFGKYVYGTTEAFAGYDIDFNRFGCICNNKEKFIKEINALAELKPELYNENARQCYEENYSMEACDLSFEELVEML